MKRTETNWKAKDGLNIFAQIWEPENAQAKAVVCLVHGIGEHGGRYAHVAEAFGKAGYAFVAPDLRGHGRSGGARGHISAIEDILRDIDVEFEQARARYPGLPLILYGHSLGGILVLHYSLKRKPQVKGVIATSSGLRTAIEQQPAKIFAARLLGSLLPTVTLPTGLEANAISRDPQVIAAYNADPLVHDKMSLGFGKIMLGVVGWTLAHAAEFPLPLLLLHGKADRIAFVSGSMEVAAALPGKSTLKIWDDAYHELHNEPEKEAVFQTMTEWMDARVRA